jgi:hypothetical protein
MAFYQLKVGQGINPSAWYQVGADSVTPLVDGELAIWDTSGLDGLYALQLLVVRQDKSAHRSTVFVTVDNQPPEVEIIAPLSQQEIEKTARPSIVLQAQAADNLELASVVFSIDGHIIASFTQPPYAISWLAALGRHNLRVVAADQAGNTSFAQVTFEIR